MVLTFQFQDLLLKQIDVRLLLIAHLFDFSYVLGLLSTRLFKHSDRFSLFLANLVIPLILLVGPSKLLSKHLDVALDLLSDTALSVDLDVQRT